MGKPKWFEVVTDTVSGGDPLGVKVQSLPGPTDDDARFYRDVRVLAVADLWNDDGSIWLNEDDKSGRWA